MSDSPRRYIITPNKALYWLSYNSPSNRPIDMDLAYAMAINIPTIIPGLIEFNEEGLLTNGQHRLTAIAIQREGTRYVVTVQGKPPGGGR